MNAASVPAAPAKVAPTTQAAEQAPEKPAPVYLTVWLSRDPAVHSELKLKSKQTKAVQAAIAEVDETLWRLRDVPLTDCGVQLDLLLADFRKSLARELSAPQSDRLEQLVLQARGSKALLSPDLTAKLGLKPDQVAELRTIIGDAAQERERLEQEIKSLSPAKQAQARDKQHQQETKRISDALTATQRSDLSALFGKPFDMGKVTTVGCIAPEMRSVDSWFNSEPLKLAEQRGKVVVVHFWAFACINCIRNLPHYQAWHEKFKSDDVTIVGIHTPETADERSADNLRRQVADRGIRYPVAFDAKSENWKAWGNNMWPSVYLIDKQGRVRNWWYGELNWEGAKGEEFMRQRIAELVAEKP